MRHAGLSFAATGNKQLTKFIARLQSLAISCNGWYGSDGYCLMPRPLSSPVLSFQLTTLQKNRMIALATPPSALIVDPVEAGVLELARATLLVEKLRGVLGGLAFFGSVLSVEGGAEAAV